jgi:hypothetical protein
MKDLWALFAELVFFSIVGMLVASSVLASGLSLLSYWPSPQQRYDDSKDNKTFHHFIDKLSQRKAACEPSSHFRVSHSWTKC